MKAGMASLRSGALGNIKSGKAVFGALQGAAKGQKLSGPMAKLKKDMGRHVKLDGVTSHMTKIKEAAEKKAQALRDLAEAQAEKAMAAAKEAGEKATAVAVAKMEEAKQFAEAQADKALAAAMDGMDGELLDDSLTPEEQAEKRAAAKKGASCHIFKVDNKFRQFSIKVVSSPAGWHARLRSRVPIVHMLRHPVADAGG